MDFDSTARPYRDTDAAGVATLINDTEVHFGGHPSITATQFGEWMAEVHDREQDTRLVAAPDGSVAAFGSVSVPKKGRQRAHLPGGVHPNWRGRGLGRALLGWQLDRIGAARRVAGAAPEWRVQTGCHQADTTSQRLFERFGLTPNRYWFEMEAPTADVVDVPDLDGFRIVTTEGVDESALYEAHMEAFADHFGFERRSFDEWMVHALGSSLYRPELSRIAYAGDEIAGYVLAYDEAQPDALYIGQVGTRAPWRGRHLASTLLIGVLAAGAKAGKTAVRLGVDATNPTGAVGVYERVGFTAIGRSVSYATTLPPNPAEAD